MFTINSKNRGAAKKLLTLLGHDAVDVRNMPLATIESFLTLAVNQGLITKVGVERALGIDAEKRAPKDPGNYGDGGDLEDSDDTDNSGGDGEGDSDNDASESGDGESDGEGEPDKGDSDAGESESESEDDGDSDGDDSDGDSDSNSDSDNAGDDPDSDSDDGDENDDDDSESESESESENDSDDESENESPEDDDDSEPEHEMLKTVLKYIRAGLNVALVGPAGTGKSYMARQIAALLERDYYVNGAMLSKYDLIGYCDAGGVYHGTPAHDAFKNGGVHCFDELDASAPDAVVAFNGMTDDQPFYTFPCGQIAQHDDYVAIACMNTWGNGASADYVGRYKQDAASMTRFVKVFIDYDPKIEAKCGPKDIVDRVQAVRAACETLAIRHIVSTRMIVQAAKARTIGKATKAEIDRDVIFAGLDTSAITQIKAQMTRAKKEASS